MDEKPKQPAYDFDSRTTNNHIQILKTAIPYMEPEKQKYIAIYIKFLELSYTISFFQGLQTPPPYGACSAETFDEKKPDLLSLLEEIKHFCTKEEQKFIDMMLNMLSAFQMFNTYQTMMQAMAPPEGGDDGNGSGGMDPFAMLKGMLTPEQQSMFDMFQDMNLDLGT